MRQRLSGRKVARCGAPGPARIGIEVAKAADESAAAMPVASQHSEVGGRHTIGHQNVATVHFTQLRKFFASINRCQWYRSLQSLKPGVLSLLQHATDGRPIARRALILLDGKDWSAPT